MPYRAGSIGQLRKYVTDELCELDSPQLEADYIVSHYAARGRPWVHAHADDPAPPELLRDVKTACARRKKREPLQYILGRCDFCGLSVIVEEGCLVPRPETELLVEAAAQGFQGDAFLDWGTGTGCIALALLNRFPRARAIMAEKNPKSLRCAWRNLKERNWLDRALLWHSHNVNDIPDCSVSLIVSNPPYIPSDKIEKLMPEVSQYEPRLALDGGPDGLEPYRWLFRLCSRVLKPAGRLCVEYGGKEQTEALKKLAPAQFIPEGVLLDIAGQERVLQWRFTDALR